MDEWRSALENHVIGPDLCPTLSLLEHIALRSLNREPVAFVGGMFAGLLRLDLNEEPLKEWVSRTVEASGMAAEEIRKRDAGEEEEEERPQEIEIE
ncbi:hypothetical protein Sango_1649200 [Sesamum angolense]|uniref:Uncharacterized protein n=1 Tax=Sesamum angolense TaxID=2727404 RepID=A0AAE1WKR8_9LAMI|nr:hypothetical protein Sango_1649200 [Sesamum angolense]